MSDVSQIIDTVKDLESGKISPEQFLNTIAADLAKDAHNFSLIPGVEAFWSWAVTAIIADLTKTSLSSTLQGILAVALKALVPKAA